MPHCILECSPEILAGCDQNTLMQSCFDAAFASELFEADDIKVRLLPLQNQLVGETGLSQLHIDIKILDGRTPEQRKQLADGVLIAVQQYLLSCAVRHASLSVEISEIERASYAKVIL